ncbi:UNVERIFIED_CONTAM: hypothetical protein RMT77_005553 [Armadillidium vulgare]
MVGLIYLPILILLSSPLRQTIKFSSAGPFYNCEDIDKYICGFTDCYWYSTTFHKQCCRKDIVCPTCCYNKIGDLVCYDYLDCSNLYTRHSEYGISLYYKCY